MTDRFTPAAAVWGSCLEEVLPSLSNSYMFSVTGFRLVTCLPLVAGHSCQLHLALHPQYRISSVFGLPFIHFGPSVHPIGRFLPSSAALDEGSIRIP